MRRVSVRTPGPLDPRGRLRIRCIGTIIGHVERRVAVGPRAGSVVRRIGLGLDVLGDILIDHVDIGIGIRDRRENAPAAGTADPIGAHVGAVLVGVAGWGTVLDVAAFVLHIVRVGVGVRTRTPFTHPHRTAEVVGADLLAVLVRVAGGGAVLVVAAFVASLGPGVDRRRRVLTRGGRRDSTGERHGDHPGSRPMRQSHPLLEHRVSPFLGHVRRRGRTVQPRCAKARCAAGVREVPGRRGLHGRAAHRVWVAARATERPAALSSCSRRRIPPCPATGRGAATTQGLQVCSQDPGPP